MKNELIRKTWPKIRLVKIKGQTLFRVDARRKGTTGRQESFKNLQEAEKRAGDIERSFSDHGKRGLEFPPELQGMALMAEKLLKPHGKTILQAAQFYFDHLEHEKRKKASAKVAGLAADWLQDKQSGKTKKLRAPTLRGIKEASEILKELFPDTNILAVTAGDIDDYLAKLKVGLRRKFNVHSRFSQFFNWCIARGHTTFNPCDKIEIHVDGKDVAILAPAEVLDLMKLCKEKHPDLILYHAISLFAGLRPTECQLLKWNCVHFEEKTITVLAETSKTKETRTVPVEPNLMAWLEQTDEKDKIGFVTAQRNFVKRLKLFHVALGYRGAGENKAAPEWPQDVLRHSYGSYWLAKYRNRAVLAENMGNSIQIIKKHYKKVVGKADCAKYWLITPTYDGTGEVVGAGPSPEEATAARMKRLGAVVNQPSPEQ